MTEKEQQFNQWFDQYANGVKVFEEVDMKQAYLQGRAELEKENAELKAENQKWKDEWQEQVQKATDEGYARTLQTMQLTKAKEIMNIAIEGIKHWGVVGGTERPFEKQAEMLFNLFLDKAEQFLSEVEK